MSEIIKTTEIAKKYIMGSETIHALKTVSITINKGEYVAFMGPSGSGKSTLMNIISGLIKPNYGSIIINGIDITNYPVYLRTRKFKISISDNYNKINFKLRFILSRDRFGITLL